MIIYELEAVTKVGKETVAGRLPNFQVTIDIDPKIVGFSGQR